MNEGQYWELLQRTIVGNHAPENVVLTEIEPFHQKTRPDFDVTARRLGITVVDIRSLEAIVTSCTTVTQGACWFPLAAFTTGDRRRADSAQSAVAV